MDMIFAKSDEEQVEFGNLIPVDDEPVEEAFDTEDKEEIYIDTNRPIDDDGLFDNTLETKTEVEEDLEVNKSKKVLVHNEGLSTYTVMFFHKGDTYTGVISATSEEDAKKKFAEYCPHCSIDRVQKGRLAFEAPYIGPDFEENMGWDEKETPRYEVIDSKSVLDSDGFYTDYTLYHDNEEDKYLCIFGDEDLYTPSNTEPDVEFDTEKEAIEWFVNYNGFDEDVDENWGWQDRTKKVLEYAEEDIPAIKDYLIHCYPDETAGYESADIEDALYGLNKEPLPLKGVELPFVFEMIEFDEDGDDIEDFTEGYPKNDDEVYINAAVRKHLNSICQKYCGWKEPKDIRPLWNELVEAGVDPIMVSGYPTSIAPDGGRSWEISFTMNDKPVRNSLFIYSVYESDGDSLKNEYNIYFS